MSLGGTLGGTLPPGRYWLTEGKYSFRKGSWENALLIGELWEPEDEVGER